MDTKTLNLLLDELEVLAGETVNPSTAREKGGLHGPLSLLADVSRLGLLSEFEKRAGASLERVLTDLACSWPGRMTSCVDHELKYAIHVLLKIGGSGFTKLVNRQLASESKYARLDGIHLSLARPDSQTRRLLSAITQSLDMFDDKRAFLLLQAKATVALAALGENRAVVDSILRWGKVLVELPGMREGQPPMTDDDLTGAMDALAGADEEKRTNAVFALGVSGRVDLAPQIRQVLSEVEPDSEIAKACAIALGHFGDTHRDSMALLEAQLHIPRHMHAALLALLEIGDQESLTILERALRRRGIVSEPLTGDFLAASLGMRQETRTTVAEVLWADIQENGDRWLDPMPGLECLGELDTPEVHEFLVELANSSDQNGHVPEKKITAVRTLAKVDRDAAFRAAETSLRVGQRDREHYPALLIEIDDARAVAVLMTVYSHGLPTLAKWAVGRALRQSRERPEINSRLDQMMRAELPEARIVGVELGGWLPPDVLGNRIRQLAMEDSDRQVRLAAEKSVAAAEQEQYAIELLEAIEKAHGSRCWSYMEAVVNLRDPWLLVTRNDRLFLWERVSEKPPGFKRHAAELIKERMEKLRKEAESADRAANR